LGKVPNMSALRFTESNKFPNGAGDQVGGILNQSSKLAQLWLGGKRNRMPNTNGLYAAVQRSCSKRLSLLNDIRGQTGKQSMAGYDGWGWKGRTEQYQYEMAFIIEYVKKSSLHVAADSSDQHPDQLQMILNCGRSGFTVETGGWSVGDKFVPMLAGQTTVDTLVISCQYNKSWPKNFNCKHLTLTGRGHISDALAVAQASRLSSLTLSGSWDGKTKDENHGDRENPKWVKVDTAEWAELKRKVGTVHG